MSYSKLFVVCLLSVRLTFHHRLCFYLRIQIQDASAMNRIYRGADKSLTRPISRYIFLMVRIFRLMIVLFYIYIYIYILYIYIYTGCPGRNVPDFGRMFLKLKYTDITQNTYIQS